MCHLFLGLVVPRLWYLVNLIHDYHFSVHICISLRAYLVRISNQAWLYIHIMICGLHSRCSCCCCCCYHIKYRVDHKKGFPPPPPANTLTRRGAMLFDDNEVFYVLVVESNGSARCLRFHGTLFFIHSPSLCPNSPTPNALWYKHSPLRNAKRTCG